MGSQQILLIVLGVIVIGIAVAVGLMMFNSQASNSNRQVVVSDLNNFASMALAFYKTNTENGGGGETWGTTDQIGQWLGFSWNGTYMQTENGTYTPSISGDDLTIIGTGTEVGNNGSSPVQATIIVTGATGNISITVNN